MTAAASILSVQTGKAEPLGPKHVPSGFVKSPRCGKVCRAAIGPSG